MSFMRFQRIKLCAWREEVLPLKNKVFKEMSGTKRRCHLAAILRHSAGGMLSNEMIGRILPKVALHKQYTVSVFAGSRDFQEAVVRAQADETQMHVVFAHGGSNAPVAAVISPPKMGRTTETRCAILICAPKPYWRKGEKT